MTDTKAVREKAQGAFPTSQQRGEWACAMLLDLCDELDALRQPIAGVERPDMERILKRVADVENHLDGPLCWESVGDKCYATVLGTAYPVNEDDPDPAPGEIERQPYDEESGDFVAKYEFMEILCDNETQIGGHLFDLFCKAPGDLKTLCDYILALEAQLARTQPVLQAAREQAVDAKMRVPPAKSIAEARWLYEGARLRLESALQAYDEGK